MLIFARAAGLGMLPIFICGVDEVGGPKGSSMTVYVAPYPVKYPRMAYYSWLWPDSMATMAFPMFT